ncbi:MAG: ABC transporter substrate-binding protein [Proteobacteria bacterium]|nr:ABC transporter substrate-binding protein [Pseudomonadota bacterium]
MRRLFALAIAAGLVAAPAFAQDVPARVKQAGKIVIATMPNYAPITYKDPANNKLMGFDIDLGEAIAKELGLAIEWQEIAFAQMLPSLQTGRVDTVLAGMSDLPARRETADFIDYMKSGPQFFTLTSLAGSIKSPEDLCGKAVGASRSTNWPKQIEEWSQANCVAKGKPAINVTGTEGSVDARTQLKTQRIQAAVQGNETLPYFQQLEPNTYVVLGTAFTESLSGMPFPKTAEGMQLRAAVKGAIERLITKGIYEKIAATHGLQANNIGKVGENLGQ